MKCTKKFPHRNKKSKIFKVALSHSLTDAYTLSKQMLILTQSKAWKTYTLYFSIHLFFNSAELFRLEVFQFFVDRLHVLI